MTGQHMRMIMSHRDTSPGLVTEEALRIKK
jgi:hypothetical protein